MRRFTQSYLEPDSYTLGKEGIGYAVHSLYLDSPDLMTCRATLRGEKNRFKVRIRFYDNDPQGPVYLEIKRRIDSVVLKQRAPIRRQSVERLLAGQWPDRCDLIKDDDHNVRALSNFCELCAKIDARPAAYTSYLREGYEPTSNNIVRVTFDRQIRAAPFSGAFGITDLEKWAQVDVGGVVLELKFTDRFPHWMQELVETFELTRTSVPKYVQSLSLVNSYLVL